MIGDRYSLDREIGRGGMGAVWLGRDELLGRAVALKRVGIAPGGSSPDLMRAEREARIAASLNHPNIVGVFDLVDDGDVQYLVMEYVEGTTLAELVREKGALPQQQVARLLAQVASALAAAHANHVVHRDVKPSNILVRDDGQVKLSDFGIARNETDNSLTQTGLVTGSPAYLSPEVASGQLATPASDVWSLGATLYHALSGRPPYDVGDNVLGALYRIVNEPVPRLDEAGEMAPVLLATMAHDPRRRWNMEDVARVLDLLAVSSEEGGRRAAPPAPVPADGTQQLRSVPTRVEPEPVPVLAPEPPPAPVEPPRRRRRPVLPIVVGLLVVVLLCVIAALSLMDDPQENDTPPVADPSSSQGATRSPDEPPTTEPTSTPAAPTDEELEAFITDYLSTASSDPAAGYTQLTPAFQAASGGIDGYSGFWGDVSNPRLLSVSADPEALTVTYTYRFNQRGEGVQTDDVTLQLVQDGDRLLIDGEA
ncbi:serine/threonine-protein kinase [Nocardioides sp.]|uniref:serine/threonine-protein kinase n=1 Tax=Nocardioides sp. TaxID=35761 RepID=UPI0027235EDB|nr:serine/threonine-protein kinase [Nocardioides sp.]MDO9454869.1 serine/threonine-protein kinase [Nocardioides sp.]